MRWLALAVLLVACAREGADAPLVVAPDLAQYSQAFQSQLADEIEAQTNIACPRDIIVPNCSAWLRAVVDYGHMREQSRAALSP